MKNKVQQFLENVQEAMNIKQQTTNQKTSYICTKTNQQINRYVTLPEHLLCSRKILLSLLDDNTAYQSLRTYESQLLQALLCTNYHEGVAPQLPPHLMALGEHIIDIATRNEYIYSAIGKIKTVVRSCHLDYVDLNGTEQGKRKETVPEHITGKQIIYQELFKTFDDFAPLAKHHGTLIKISDFHDDGEIITTDYSIADEAAKEQQNIDERAAIPRIASMYGEKLGQRLTTYDNMFRYGLTSTNTTIRQLAQLAHAVDKLEPIIRELRYPEDRGTNKKFGEADIRRRSGPAMQYHPVFRAIFETTIDYMKQKGGYF